jgi:Oxidoreductase family, NAD-binding Rossmann fold
LIQLSSSTLSDIFIPPIESNELRLPIPASETSSSTEQIFSSFTKMPPQKLKIACAGLGRMGKRHALHFLNRTPRAELVAVSTPDDDEIQWAKQHLEPFGVRLYKDYDAMLRQEGLQAVVIASVTTVHAEQAIKAIEANLHVLCEKPLSTSVEVVSSYPILRPSP